MKSPNLGAIIQKILRDVEVELRDEFDQNFERGGFFLEAWQRRKSPLRGDGALLQSTGALRRSIDSKVVGNTLVFFSTLPYARIHNEGGAIKVTRKMKKYFWHKYYESIGGWGRKKDGSVRNTKSNRKKTVEADFWKAMALMPAGKSIRIPRRRFLGNNAVVEVIVRRVISDCLSDYFDKFEIVES